MAWSSYRTKSGRRVVRPEGYMDALEFDLSGGRLISRPVGSSSWGRYQERGVPVRAMPRVMRPRGPWRLFRTRSGRKVVRPEGYMDELRDDLYSSRSRFGKARYWAGRFSYYANGGSSSRSRSRGRSYGRSRSYGGYRRRSRRGYSSYE